MARANDQKPRFNLLDEPWIPVVWRMRPNDIQTEVSAHPNPRHRQHSDACRSEIGVLDVLENARHIRSLADSTPIINLALLRFLVAVLHAAGVTSGDEADAWKHKLDAYFENWRGRFWLYHPEWPFMQVAAKRSKKPDKSIATLSHALAQATNIAHFAHCTDGVFGLSLPECARALLLQTIAPTNSGQGFKAGINGAPPVYMLVDAKSLFESLRMHLPEAARAASDAPSWEGVTSQKSSVGYLEGLTWQPRAMLLEPADSQGVVRKLVYDQGKSADSVKSATRDAKIQPSRLWELDPHAIPMKYRSPLSENPAATTPVRVLEALTHHQPWILKRLSQSAASISCQVCFVANDGKAKFFSTDASRIEVPTAVLKQAEHWLPIKKQYKFQLGSVFSLLYQIERLSDLEAHRVVAELLTKVASYENPDTKLLDRKAREAFESDRLNTLGEPLQSAKRAQAAVRGADAFLGLLGEVRSETSHTAGEASRLIESLTDAKTFGPTALHRLRTPAADSYEALVPLTDFLNDELRNKRLLRGRDRRWGWLLVRLYARHPHHQIGAENQFGRCLWRLAQHGRADGTVRRQLLQMAGCSLDQFGTLFSELMGNVARLRTRDNRPYPVDYSALLNDLMSLETNRFQIVGKWLKEARVGQRRR